ncbi:hypothetical protein EDB19DRAFT_2048007 [Suillus lakei]|nr:hypothetical protein EDB19DRAFT_2048007 [Suillus lakei]
MATQPRWTQNLVSDMMRRRHRSNIELREPLIVEVPCTAGKLRNYHARRKPATSSSRPSKIPHTTLQPNGAAQNTPSSPPPTTTAATVSVSGATGTISRPRITVDSGWRARFLLWVCCVPTQTTDGQH